MAPWFRPDSLIWGIPATIRLAVVQGHNESEESIHRLAESVKGLAGSPPVELLAYSGYDIPKYGQRGRVYSLTELDPPTPQHMLRLRHVLRAYGLRCEIV